MPARRWRLYKSPSGATLFVDELMGIKQPMGTALLRDVMRRYETHETLSREVLPLSGGLLELRTSSGNNQFRVLFFHPRPRIAVALVAFYKNTQQTPKTHLRTAQTRMGSWLSRP